MINRPIFPDKVPDDAKPALSYSAVKILSKCDRRWGLQYVNEVLPYARKRLTVIEKTLQPEGFLGGSIIHKVVDEALRGYLASGFFPSRRDLIQRANHWIDMTLEFSHLWLADVRHGGFGRKAVEGYEGLSPLSCIYYLGEVQDAYLQSTREKIKKWIDNFLAFMDTEKLFERETKDWILGEPYSWFWWEDLPVYAIQDFVLINDDSVTIYDLKSGSKEFGEEELKQQFLYYAAAATYWGEVGDLKCVGIWLETGSTTRIEIEREEIEELHSQLQKHYVSLRDRRSKVFRNPASFDSEFEMTNDSSACSWCQFRTCDGYKRVLGSPADSAYSEPDEY